MANTNPYTPPNSIQDLKRHEAARLFTPGFFTGVLLLAAVAVCACRVIYLHHAYPGLNDATPGADGYWPKIDALLMYLASGFMLIVAIPTLSATLANRRRRMTQPMPSTLSKTGG